MTALLAAGGDPGHDLKGLACILGAVIVGCALLGGGKKR